MSRECLKARGHLLVLDLDGRMVARKLGMEGRRGPWFIWPRMWPTVWFCEHGTEPVGFIKDAVSTVDVSFLNERVRKNESAIGLLRSGSGLGGHVIRSDTDGSVSFIVQQLRFRPQICLIHHHSSFFRVSGSTVSVSDYKYGRTTCTVLCY